MALLMARLPQLFAQCVQLVGRVLQATPEQAVAGDVLTGGTGAIPQHEQFIQIALDVVQRGQGGNGCVSGRKGCRRSGKGGDAGRCHGEPRVFFDWPLPKKAKAGSSKLYTNSQAYSPEGSCISLLPAMDSRKHAAACQARGIKKAKGHGLASVV